MLFSIARDVGTFGVPAYVMQVADLAWLRFRLLGDPARLACNFCLVLCPVHEPTVLWAATPVNLSSADPTYARQAWWAAEVKRARRAQMPAIGTVRANISGSWPMGVRDPDKIWPVARVVPLGGVPHQGTGDYRDTGSPPKPPGVGLGRHALGPPI